MATYPAGRRTRQEILEAAEELLAARGYHAVALSDISQAAGCAKASVMYHFRTKIEILAAIMEPVVESYDALHEQIAELPPAEVQQAAIEGYVDLVLRHRHAAAILRLELANLLSEEAMAPLLRAGAFLPAALTGGRTDAAAQARAMFGILGVLGASLQDFTAMPEPELRDQLVQCLADSVAPLTEGRSSSSLPDDQAGSAASEPA